MKYLLVIFDGMADEPIPELDGKTPLQVANKPNMDYIAGKGIVGTVYTTPEGMQPGSDITNMGILGYDPQKYYTGRGPLEAASLEIPLETSDVAFRCNLVTTDGEKMIDSSAGHISTKEARELIELIDKKLGSQKIKFYPGVSYRHIMVWHNGSDNVDFTAPYKIHGKLIKDFMPQGDGAEKLSQMMFDSFKILDDHPINRRRKDEGRHPANMIWFWGQGRQPNIPSFFSKFGKTGAVVAAVDLIRGIGRMVGLKLINVPGATGYIDTNYLGKGQYAVRALQECDFVWVHVEAPDEAGHEQDLDKKIAAIQDCDSKVLGTIISGLKSSREHFRILLLPDHPTPIATGSHSANPVPFVLYDSNDEKNNSIPFDERANNESQIKIIEAYRLIEMLFSN